MIDSVFIKLWNGQLGTLDRLKENKEENKITIKVLLL